MTPESRRALSLLTKVIGLLIASVALEIVAQFLPPYFNPIRDSESALAIGPFGVLESISLCLRGALVFLLLNALAMLVPRDSISKAGALLLAIGAAFKFVIAFVATDLSPLPETAHGFVHAAFAFASFFATAIGALLVSRRLSSASMPRQLLLRLAQFTVAWTVVVAATVALRLHFWGLLERIETALLLSWMAIVAITLRHRLKASGVRKRMNDRRPMRLNQRTMFAIVSILALVGVLGVALANMPSARTNSAVRTPDALEADKLFWATFHGARYGDIQNVLDALTAAYVAAPTDPITAAHIAWMHMWRVAERDRNPNASATITDDVVLAHKYFQRAVALDPSDARYLGFLAAATMSEGGIDHDDKLAHQGYAALQAAVKAWPEFNLFTAGYIMSVRPPASPQFKEGLERQWQNMEVCARAKIDRAKPDYSPYMALETKVGKERACWNSAIAPHNLEGFFLNMGDMLVKAGDWQTAQEVYWNAMLSKEYATWKYQNVLADRIGNAHANVVEFNEPNSSTKMMIDSTFACTACHQE